MIRLLHIIIFLFLIHANVIGQNKSYNSFVEQGSFKLALEVADTPMEKIQCLLNLSQIAEADSLLTAHPIPKQDSLYCEFCRYQSVVKRRLRKYKESNNWIEEGLNNCAVSSLLYQSVLENKGYNYIILGEVDKGQKIIESVLEKKLALNANANELALTYNNLAIAHYYKNEYQQALQYIDKGLEQTDKLAVPCFYASKLLGNRGVFLNKLGDMDNALKTYERAVELKKQLVDSPYSPALYITYNNIIIIHKLQRNYQKFANYLDTMEMVLENSPENAAWSAQLYINKALSKTDHNEKEKEIEKLLLLEPKFTLAEKINLVTAYNILFEIAYRKSDISESENYLNKAMETLQTIPNYPIPKKVKILRRKAMLEKSQKKYVAAYKTINESINLFKENFSVQDFRLHYPLLTLCELNILTKNYDEAIVQAKEILEIDKKAHGDSSSIISTYFLLMGKIETLQGNYNNAIPYLKTAIARSSPHEEMKYFIVDRAHEHLSTCYAELGQPDKAINAQMKMLQLWEFETTAKKVISADKIPPHFYYRALQTFEVHLKFLEKYKEITTKEVTTFLGLYNKMKSDYFYESSTLGIKKGVKNLFQLSIQQQYNAYTKDKNPERLNLIFELMETYKNSLVDLKMNTSRSDSRFPPHLLQKENEIRYNYEHAYQEYKQANENYSEKIDSTLKAKLLKWQNEKLEFLDIVKTEHPEFYKSRSNPILSLNEVQQKIKLPKQKYLSFHLSDGFSYGIFISKDTTHLFRINSDTLKKATTDLIQYFSIKEANNSELSFAKNKSTFIENAERLHQLLIQPIASFLAKEDDLCIIPDEQLFYLPFDILLTSKSASTSSYKTLPYLIKKYNLHYANSVNNSILSSNNKNTNSLNYIGFAPESEGGIAYSNFRGQDILFANKEEITFAEKHFNGIGYYGQDASKEKFLENAPKANILHLATHAIVDDEVPMNSSLQFFSDASEQSLKVHEIAQLELNNKLVVLSACATQSGKFANGEGLLSITRAFQLAGSHNLISTLWPVNDQVAEKIIQNFWSHTNEGNATSLRKSKLQYLKDCSELYAHPFYWSSFIFQGQNQPIQQQRNQLFYIGFTLFLGVIGLFFLKFKK